MPLVRDKKYYKELATKAEKTHGIPDNLLVRLLDAESSYNPEIISGKRKSSAGAIGIAQFMPQTAKEYNIDPTNAEQSIEAAAKYLKKSYSVFGNWEDSVRSYNAGVQKVKDWKKGIKKLPKETIDYTNKIFGKTENKSDYKEVTTPNIYTDITNFDTPTQTNTFVPIEQEESKTKEEIAVEQKTNEYNLLKDFQLGKIQIQPTQQRPQQTEVPQIDVMQQYAEISNLVEQGREGGFFEGWSFNTIP